MKLYGGIDLHSNSSVVALSDEEDHVVYRKRLANEGRRVSSGAARTLLRIATKHPEAILDAA